MPRVCWQSERGFSFLRLILLYYFIFCFVGKTNIVIIGWALSGHHSFQTISPYSYDNLTDWNWEAAVFHVTSSSKDSFFVHAKPNRYSRLWEMQGDSSPFLSMGKGRDGGDIDARTNFSSLSLGLPSRWAGLLITRNDSWTGQGLFWGFGVLHRNGLTRTCFRLLSAPSSLDSPSGGIGRRDRLKIYYRQRCGGSSPSWGTKSCL